MSRDIKFRAWSSGEMLYPIRLDEMVLEEKSWTFTGSIEFMQYTGLLDKNGKEIYEGDIVHYRDYDTNINHNRPGDDWEKSGTAYIEFNEGAFKLYELEDGDIEHGALIEEWADCEIIGNVYQNPELLEAK